MRKITFCLFLSLFSILNSFGQAPEDLNKVIVPLNSEQVVQQKERNINSGPIEIEICDDDQDGFYSFDLSEIESQALSMTSLSDNEVEAVAISTSAGELIKIETPSTNPTVELICQTSFPLTDVAIDQNGDYYVCGFSNISSLDDNCNSSSFLVGGGINSLSFDTANNLYYGANSSSSVFRYDINGTGPEEVWHNFGQGTSGGDFVVVDDKMYIAWTLGSSFRLYEVTYDANFDYVSHTDLGSIKSSTFGLASELGTLYGVTPNELYKIDLETMQFTTVLTNNGISSGAWWGAAGFHEAVSLDVSTHISNNDAEAGTNSISGDWTNTISEGQTIYIRIENSTTGEYEIVEVIITINLPPNTTEPGDLGMCSDDEEQFDLTEVENELLAEVSGSVTITYHESLNDAQNEINSVATDYVNLSSPQNIFVRVQNTENDCFSIEQFALVSSQYPNLTPISNEENGIYLDLDCAANNMVDLNTIYSDLVLDANPNYVLRFYTSLQDAQNATNEIGNQFELPGISTEEIFVSVENDFGCIEIGNFFVRDDCPDDDFIFPLFLTPNGDGYHDFWNVETERTDLLANSTIRIFDRYGKLLSEFNPEHTPGWRGVLNGYNLPASDYWFTFEVKTLGRTYRGHFSLVR